MIALILRDFLAYRLAVDILATLGSGENRLATRVEQLVCSTRVANRFPPLAHSGEGDKQQTFSFSFQDKDFKPKMGSVTLHREEKMKDKKPSHLTLVEKRSLEASISIASEIREKIAYQHTVLCQTCMPYRNPGNDVFRWERRQGDVQLLISAGEVIDPSTERYAKIGLPFGPKARLILAHLNAEALRTGSPEIETERSLTAFVRRLQDPTKRGKSGPNGQEIRAFKDHLMRLSVATIRMAMMANEHAVQINNQFVDVIELWLTKDENNRVRWSPTLHLNQKYFDSLQKHVVPLDERALAALSHSAMALDIYAWLAQRLHRIPHGKPQSITWAALKGQFGVDHSRMDHFRSKFRTAMFQVLACYPKAKIEADHKGLTLRHSPPPISARVIVVEKPGDR